MKPDLGRNTWTVRERVDNDDILNIKGVSCIVRNGKHYTIPERRKSPLVVWPRHEIKADGSDANIKLCLQWPEKTDSLCHNCCHAFDTIPVPLPYKFDVKRQIYHCRGVFCSWQCAKSFNLRETPFAAKGNRCMYIALLARQMWTKYNDEKLSKDVIRQYSYYSLDPAPPKTCLKAFGGSMDIEEYRKNFFGIIAPSAAKAGPPYLTLYKKLSLPFLDLDKVTDSSVLGKRTIGETMPQHQAGTKRINTSSVHQFNNAFCSVLKRAKDDPSLMRRKKEVDTENTLLSCMGISVKRKE